MFKQKYFITKDELQKLFDEGETREEISIIKKIPLATLRDYIRKWKSKEYHRCRYCGTEENLIIQKQKDNYYITNSCYTCSYKGRGEKISQAHKNRTEEEIKITNEKRSLSMSKRTEEDKRITLEKRKNTSLLTWGFEYPMQSPILVTKMLASYDAKNPEGSRSNNVKTWWNSLSEEEKIQRHLDIEATMEDKYHYKNAFQVPEFEQKSRDTCLERYNAPYHMQNKDQAKKNGEIRKNRPEEDKQKSKNKYINTCLVKFGAVNYLASEEYKKYMLDTFGVPYAFMLPSTQKGVSAISQDMCWKIYNYLNDDLKDNCYFSELNQEYMVGTNLWFNEMTGANKKCYFLDFTLKYKDIKFAVEFQGDYWHKNPEIYGEEERSKCLIDDNLKEWFLIQNDFYVCYIWEKDYTDDKEKSIISIIEQIEDLYNIKLL